MTRREFWRQAQVYTKPGSVIAVNSASVQGLQKLLAEALRFMAQQEPSNTERVERVNAAIEAYYDHRGDEPDDEFNTASDLLADLMHWCHAENVDFDTALHLACKHYEAEA